MGRQALLAVAQHFQFKPEDVETLDQRLYRADDLVIKLIDVAEADIYCKLEPVIDLPLIYLENDVLVMKDLGTALTGQHLTAEQMMRIMGKVIHIQHAAVDLPLYPLDEIERVWLRDLCEELDSHLMATIDSYYHALPVRNYRQKLPLVLTHGDLHRGNIFDCTDIQLIDWERAALSSPVRDITMLLQDYATVEEIRFYRDAFFQLLPFEINHADYRQEFNIFLLVNTVKMLVWELSKYQQGMQQQDETMREVARKMAVLKLLEE